MGKPNRSKIIKAYEVVMRIEKDMTTHLPITGPLYEKAILEAVHPEANVNVIKVNGVKEYDLVAERERLAMKYGANPETERSYMDEVYGRGGRDIDRVERDLEDDLEVESIQSDQGKVDVDTLSAKEIKKRLDDLEIEYPATATKDRLKSLLKSAMDEDETTAKGPGDEEDEDDPDNDDDDVQTGT